MQKQLKRHCGRVFHQTCEGRQPEAGMDQKLFDSKVYPSGDTENVLRDLSHHLCGPCLEVVQPQDPSTKYTRQLPGTVAQRVQQLVNCLLQLALTELLHALGLQRRCSKLRQEGDRTNMPPNSVPCWPAGPLSWTLRMDVYQFSCICQELVWSRTKCLKAYICSSTLWSHSSNSKQELLLSSLPDSSSRCQMPEMQQPVFSKVSPQAAASCD